MEPGVTARHAAPPATHHPRITIETTRPKPTQADPAYREISRLIGHEASYTLRVSYLEAC